MPLTASLYVPGALVDTDKVTIDVGTGFFVERVRLTFYIGGAIIDQRRRARKMLWLSMTGKSKSSQVI